MKKIKIITLLVLVLIFTSNLLCINVNAAVNNCTHINSNYVRTVYTYYDSGVSGHRTVTNFIYYCSNCMIYYEGNFKDHGIKSHTMEITDEHWHSGTMHYRKRVCIICGYTDTISWKCSGNPCVISLRVQLQKD